MLPNLVNYSVYVGIVTILSTLLIDVECCSMNTYDIISLMSHNPNFQNDPCYIQWKTAQDAKMTQLWTQREQLEQSIRESNRRQMEYDARERENRQRSNHATSQQSSKRTHTGFWKVMGILVGIAFIILGICFCIGNSSDDNTQTNTATNFPRNENPTVQLTSVVARSSFENQTATLTSSTINDNNSYSTNLLRRQDSLPSYDDAVKMPSAPSYE